MPGKRNFIAKVRETGFIVDTPRRGRARTVKAVPESVYEIPSTTTRYRSQGLNILHINLQ